MERKLATVLFVDIVGSTQLVTGADPEVVRRRVTEFFSRVSHCVAIHGGIVEKFAGDAVLAAFGIPQAHEDDAERAARAALAMRKSIHELGFEARIGIEAGEVVVDQADSTFATGEAVNLAARLQQVASPGEILVGPTAHRLARGRLLVEDAGPLELKGMGAAMRAWRVLGTVDETRVHVSAPLVGRETELELLEHTFERTLRDGRAHLFTIYGEPGVGKSRLAREFVDSVDGASVLTGRCLPYGEGVTYWPLAEMIKAAVGITDDEPLEEAFEKLRACCEDDAVADIIGLASGLLEAVEGDRSPQEISWAAREVMHTLGDVQPLILFFEDIHWAEEPMLDLVEHLADWVRAPLLILCLARPDLLDVRPGWGGGRVRSTAIELEPLSDQESEQLVEALVAELESAPPLPKTLLDRTEGNPLFVEETIRMLVEGGDSERVPDTLQALIAARIDHLAPEGKALLQRAAVVGRVFWHGAIAHLAPDLEVDTLLDDLLLREFVLREARSSISGESAFRFKHMLIREVAYSGLSKQARAQHHGRFAGWIKERAGDELLEIRAYHLDQASLLLAELDGAAPEELVQEAAEVLTIAGKRALAREQYKSARKLLVRAVELEPTLRRRYYAGRAVWRMGDLTAVTLEMEKVRQEAQAAGEAHLEALALTALSDAVLKQSGDTERAQTLIDRALELQEAETDVDAHFDSLMVRVGIGVTRGSMSEAVPYIEQAFAVALAAGRKDLQTIASQALAQAHIVRLELDKAERLIHKAVELAEASGSPRARGSAKLTLGWLYRMRKEFDAAEAAYQEARELFAEIGHATLLSFSLSRMADLAFETGDLKRSEKHMREAIRLLAPLGQHRELAEAQAELGRVLAEQGKTDEAERYVSEAQEHLPTAEPQLRLFIVLALASVRAAQERDDEAEALLLESLAISDETDFTGLKAEILQRIVRYLEQRGENGKAAAYEERLAALLPAESAAEIA
ncbi:MAG TPA: adenylate/guanylate cyclase domain-containing protein [Gaiellaceae bacterium]|nr:adenylate/guanylate cyclase domain-containing protein [Gaiellaceae bacterium]